MSQAAMSPSCLLFLHAHPDDESILTGSVLAKADSLGIRTVVVFGTQGDAGETKQDLGDETLGERRVREAEAACADLGVDRVEWLPYDDSGMDGTETTSNPAAFSNADPVALAAQIAELLADEDVAAIVGYDKNGTYGHPDHRQVHHVSHAAAAALGSQWVLEATYNREYLAKLPDADGTLDPAFAAGEAELSHYVEGNEWFERKMKALMNHTSQVPEDINTEDPPVEQFKARFGTEWFITTPYNGGTEIDDVPMLAKLLEPKATWVSPM